MLRQIIELEMKQGALFNLKKIEDLEVLQWMILCQQIRKLRQDGHILRLKLLKLTQEETEYLNRLITRELISNQKTQKVSLDQDGTLPII